MPSGERGEKLQRRCLGQDVRLKCTNLFMGWEVDMSRVSTILQAMSEKHETGPDEIAQKFGFDVDDTAKIMKSLCDGGLTELTSPDRYKRKRKYKSKQKRLPL